ncbi:MAG: hypothetical protein ACXADL_10470 [Candidatus Thorarchaeota archaeon]|jgi:hypothetical protein
MSLLGPDDFGLGKKGRKKKLAKDLAPQIQREIEKWLDEMDEHAAFERISDLVGSEEARLIIEKRRLRKKQRDSLTDK